uniref:Uncharacterized protein n=1 Tax=Arundo donax TaxID=35708 RepID=A0A0A8XYJ9_ARUDO
MSIYLSKHKFLISELSKTAFLLKFTTEYCGLAIMVFTFQFHELYGISILHYYSVFYLLISLVEPNN